MAVAFRSKSFAAVTTGNPLVLNKPVGVVSGDLLLAFVGFAAPDITVVSGPAGWTQLLVGTFPHQVWYKVAGGSEPASYTWSIDQSGAGLGGVLAYSGVSTASPINASNRTITSGGQGTNVVCPSVTTSAVESMIVCGVVRAVSVTAFTPPTGMTERDDQSQLGVGYTAADVLFAGSGATGTKTFTETSGQNASDTTFTIALRTLNHAPNAPTLTTMTGGAVIDLANTNRADWDFSDPDTGDTQSKFDLRYRVVGAGSWTTISSTTPNTFYDFVGGTFTAGNYEWQVRTYDALGEVGAYSASSFFTAAAAPSTLSITDPANGSTITAGTDTITWSTPDQDSYQVRKVADLAGSPDTSTVYYDSGEVVSAVVRTADLTFPTNSRVEHLQVRIKDGGLWSAWASISVTVAFTAPATPGIVVQENTPAGAISVQATHPTPTGSQPPVQSIDVYRRLVDDTDDGIRVAASLAALAVFEDWAVASGVEYAYRVKAAGATGTSSFSDWSEDGSGVVAAQVYGGY